MREYKNTIVTVTGDVYTLETATVPPSTWFDAHGLDWSDVTHVQGPILDVLTRTDSHTRYPGGDESTMDVLWDHIHNSKDDAPGDPNRPDVANSYQFVRTMIENNGGNFNEFLALALKQGDALTGELNAVYDSTREAYDVFLQNHYGVDSDSEIFTSGLAELDMDTVEEQYDYDSGNVLLEGEEVIYEVIL